MATKSPAGERTDGMKKLILLTLICLSIAMTFGMNNSIAYANTNLNSTSIQTKKLQKENNNLEKQNKTLEKQIKKMNFLTIIFKNLPAIIAATISIGTIVISILYRRHMIMTLNYMEKKLLNTKDSFYINVSLVGINLLGIILCCIYTIINHWFFIVVLIYLVLLIVLISLGHKQASNERIIFEYKNQKFQFLNRLDDSTITALPIEYSTTKNNNFIYLFTLADLSNHKFYISKKQSKIQKKEN